MGEGKVYFPRNRISVVGSGGLTIEDIRAIPQTLTRSLNSTETSISQERFHKSYLSSHHGGSTTPPELARVRAYNKGNQSQSSGQPLPPRCRIGKSNLLPLFSHPPKF
jgi:hypothetical protein